MLSLSVQYAAEWTWKNICWDWIKTAGSKNKTLPPQAPPSLHNGSQIRKACYILYVSKRGVSVQEIFTALQADPACSVRLERQVIQLIKLNLTCGLSYEKLQSERKQEAW